MARTFISINLPEEVKSEIEKIQDKLPLFDGKKTEFDNLHLTLKFLGEISGEKIELVKEKLSEIDFEEINAKIDSLGIFSQDFIKIVWLHLEGCEKIQRKIDDSLSRVFMKEKRFMGHITLARIKSVEDRKKFLDELGKIVIVPINFNIKEFFLMKSDLTRKGPRYEVLKKFPLKRKI